MKWRKTGLDQKELRALWLQNGPSGLNSTFHAWFDGTTIANELGNGEQPTGQPAFWHNHVTPRSDPNSSTYNQIQCLHM
jgi:hypothetical protein